MSSNNTQRQNCNILQEIEQGQQDEPKSEADLLDLSWGAMESFDNEHCELECLVQEFRDIQEKKASHRRWVFGLAVPLLVLFLLVVGAMFSFASRPNHDATGGPPEIKKSPVMIQSKYRPH